MKFELNIKIDSGNQDVVDNPNQTVLTAIDRARKEAAKMTFYGSKGLTSTHFSITDINGNTIGSANLELEGEDDD